MPDPRELRHSDDQLGARDLQREKAGWASADPVLRALHARNVLEAIGQGSISARWVLGALIGEIVCEEVQGWQFSEGGINGAVVTRVTRLKSLERPALRDPVGIGSRAPDHVLRGAHRMADQTAESIAQAKQHQVEEREQVFARTGLRITDDSPVHVYTIICPRCLTPIGAESRGKADRAFGRHFISAHVTKEQ